MIKKPQNGIYRTLTSMLSTSKKLHGLPLSAINIMRASKDIIEYQTNAYTIENKLNCTNTIRDCFKISIVLC